MNLKTVRIIVVITAGLVNLLIGLFVENTQVSLIGMTIILILFMGEITESIKENTEAIKQNNKEKEE